MTVVAAAALVTATGSLMEGGIRGAVPPERLAGADIVIAADQDVHETHGDGEDEETITSTVVERVRLPDDLAQSILAVPGVAAVVQDVSFPTYLVVNGEQAVGPDGSPSLGHSWASASVTPFRLVDGVRPTGASEVVIDSAMAHRTHLEVGDQSPAVVRGRNLEVTVTGIAELSGGRPLTEQSAIFFSNEAARSHYGLPDRSDLLAASLEEGADADEVAAELDAALSGQFVVLTGDARGRAEFLGSAESSVRLIAISGSLGGIALFVAALVLAGMITLFIQQRLREIALLRAIGATPRQVRRLLTRETIAVALLGALVGIWPGFWLSGLLAGAMRDKGLLPGTYLVEPGTWPAVAAVAAVVTVSWGAACITSRRAARVRPVEALMETAEPSNGIGWVRAVMGALCAGGTGALFLVAMSVRPSIAPALVPATLMAAVVTVALVAPVLVAIGVRLAGLLGRLFGASGFLALANARTQVRRMASAVIPLTLTVGVAGMTLIQQSTIDEQARTQRNERVTAQHVVAPGAAGLPPTVVRTLATRSSTDVIGLADTTVYAGDELDPYGAKVVVGKTIEGLLDLGVVDGSLAALGQGEVALSEDAAAGLGGRVGQSVKLRLGDGTAQDLSLVATFSKSVGFADVIVSGDTARGHLTDPLLSLVLIGGEGEAGGASAALEAVHHEHPSARIGGPEMIAASEDANADTQAWVNYLLLGLVIAFAAFAVINTLLLAIRGRSREYALLQLIGASRTQVRRMMRVEAILLVMISWTIGAAVAATTLMPFAYAVTGSFTPTLLLTPLGLVLLGTGALTWLATMLPTTATMRTRPVAAVGTGG